MQDIVLKLNEMKKDNCAVSIITLIACLEKAVSALEYISLVDKKQFGNDFYGSAERTLTEIENLLSGGKG